jgi:putative transposase
MHRLMQIMAIEAIYPKPNTSKSNPAHKIYPYLLRNLEINRPNQVWATDITFSAPNLGRRLEDVAWA